MRLALAAIGVFWAALGCSTTSGGEGADSGLAPDAGAACSSDAECGLGGPCVSGSCQGGSCVYVAVAEGAALSASRQSAGDCQRLECDGAGHERSVADPADVPVDGKECTQDLCVESGPSHPFEPVGTACGMNGALACNTEGECAGCSVHAECGLPSCSDGVLVTPECSGGGCIEKQKSCEAYACDGEHACHASCSGHAQCAPGFQCKSAACTECTTCADWFDGEYPYEYCEGSDSVTTLFEGCGCAPQECAYACATTLCSSPVMLQPDAGCRSCLEIACPWAVSECKNDVRAGQ